MSYAEKKDPYFKNKSLCHFLVNDTILRNQLHVIHELCLL